jgi:hypothetical protein
VHVNGCGPAHPVVERCAGCLAPRQSGTVDVVGEANERLMSTAAWQQQKQRQHREFSLSLECKAVAQPSFTAELGKSGHTYNVLLVALSANWRLQGQQIKTR